MDPPKFQATDISRTENGMTFKIDIPGVSSNNFIELMSEEFIISNAKFQMKFVNTYIKSSANSTTIINTSLFIKLGKIKCQPDNNVTYELQISIPAFSISMCLKNDGLWCEIYNTKDFMITNTIAMTVEVKTCNAYYLCIEPLYYDTALTDFELKGEDGSVPVHKALLALASPVMRRMLSGPWRDTAEGVVELPGMSKAVLTHFKEYIYLRKLPDEGLEYLLLLGSYYIMPDLEQAVTSKIVNCITAEKACDLLDFAYEHKVRRLQVAIFECISTGEVNVALIKSHLLSTCPKNTEFQATDINRTENGMTFKIHIPGVSSNNFIELMSEEFIISNAKFQMKFVNTYMHNNSNARMINTSLFIKLGKIKCQPDNNVSYELQISIPALSISMCLKNYGLWCEIYNTKNFMIKKIAMTVEVKTCNAYYLCIEPLYYDTALTDFELKGEDGSVPVHKALMALASPVMARMLSGHWRDTAEGVVELPGMSKAALTHFKEYIYLRKLPDKGLEYLLLLGSYYIMPDLEQAVTSKIVNCITAEKACDLLDFAYEHKVRRLQVAIFECISKGAVNVALMKSHLLSTCPKNTE